MKFVRFGSAGNERPGVLLDETTVLDISSLVADIGPDSMASLPELSERVASSTGLPTHNADSVRLGSPIARPHKIVGIGLNYSEHAAEAGMEIPTEPIVFMKATSSLSGPYDDLLMAPWFPKVDWEVELGLVIGGVVRNLADEADAAAFIAGYVLANDVSERSYQLERGGQWMKGKSADTFSPIGPWLVTPDEIGDVGNLDMYCRVNGETKQAGSTSTMIFSPSHVIRYVSQFMTLEPGDLILTGTPKGVGLSTGEYLQDGDVVELEIPGLGQQRQTCRRL